jgi:hypothetical protein
MFTDVTSAPLRALAASLTALPGYDGPDAWIPVEAVHRALWRVLYAHELGVGAPAIETLHATLAAAYALVGGYVARHNNMGYYHEGSLVSAAMLLD